LASVQRLQGGLFTNCCSVIPDLPCPVFHICVQHQFDVSELENGESVIGFIAQELLNQIHRLITVMVVLTPCCEVGNLLLASPLSVCQLILLSHPAFHAWHKKNQGPGLFHERKLAPLALGS
jgi:hypothetical protein